VKLIELDTSMEALRELGNDAGFQYGFNAAELVGDPEAERDDEQQEECECTEEETMAMEE